MSYYISRIFNNKIKLGVTLLLFFLPVFSIIMALIDIHSGASAILPETAAFLVDEIPGTTHLFVNYLPLFLAVIVSDDCIEDFKLGYKSLLISKWGKNRYFMINMLKSFILSLFIVLIPLIINLIMTQITFAGGTYNTLSAQDIESTASLKAAFQNPMLTNITYILFFSFFSGIIGMGTAAIGMALHNRFTVYPVVFIMWYLPAWMHPSIFVAFQPFTEYFMLDALPSIIVVLSINFAAIIFAYVKVIKYEQV